MTICGPPLVRVGSLVRVTEGDGHADAKRHQLLAHPGGLDRIDAPDAPEARGFPHGELPQQGRGELAVGGRFSSTMNHRR